MCITQALSRFDTITTQEHKSALHLYTQGSNDRSGLHKE